MYNNNRCAVIDSSGSSDWFEVKTGVKQGCLMSGFLFLFVIDWVKRRTVEKGNTEIRWKMTSSLEDIDFADDLGLLSITEMYAEAKVDRLNTV